MNSDDADGRDQSDNEVEPGAARPSRIARLSRPESDPARIRHAQMRAARPAVEQGQELVQYLALDPQAALIAAANGAVKQSVVDDVNRRLTGLPEYVRYLMRAHRVQMFVGGVGAPKNVAPTIARSMKTAYGVYAPELREIHVHHSAVGDGVHEYTALHETGHAVDHALGHLRAAQGETGQPIAASGEGYTHDVSNQPEGVALWKREGSNKRLPRNMLRNPGEFFADAFALYHKNPRFLEENTLKTYTYIETIHREIEERCNRVKQG